MNREALLANVIAHPYDLGARAIYADHLVELGDPHGEYVNLVLAGREADAAALRIALDEPWFDRAARSLLTDVRYRAGFLDEATVIKRASTSRWAEIRDPGFLRTIQRLRIHSDTDLSGAWAVLGALPEVAHIEIRRTAILDALLTLDQHRPQVLELHVVPGRRAIRDLHRWLPQLERIVVHVQGRPRARLLEELDLCGLTRLTTIVLP